MYEGYFKGVFMKKFVSLIMTFSLLGSLLLLSGCTKSTEVYSGTVFVMDTYATLKIYSKNDPKSIYDKCVAKLNELAQKYDVFSQTSYLNELNTKGSTDAVGSTDSFITNVFKIAKTTNYAFDPAIFPVSQIWEQARVSVSENKEVPSKAVIANALKKATMNNVQYDENTGQIVLKNGASIDLGGAVKGYATDELNKILEENGAESAVIDLGGNVLVYGKPVSGSSWTVAIRAPRDNTLGYFTTLKFTDTVSVVTSGDYERYFEVDGVRYHHIIDPATGYPTNNGLMSVSIISKNSLKADIYSTAVFVMGLEKGMEFVNNDSEVEAIFVTTDKKVYITDGLKDKIQIEDEDYKLQ